VKGGRRVNPVCGQQTEKLPRCRTSSLERAEPREQRDHADEAGIPLCQAPLGVEELWLGIPSTGNMNRLRVVPGDRVLRQGRMLSPTLEREPVVRAKPPRRS
jgi:hypothetical protein